MLATGGSAGAALRLRQEGGRVVGSHGFGRVRTGGIKALEAAHPDVDIFTASIDRELNDSAYILPGLGDFGDRLFGTDP